MKKEEIELESQKLKEMEIFEVAIGGRIITVAFDLKNRKFAEVSHAIKDPDDKHDSKFADDLTMKRLGEKRNNVHYEKLGDIDILEYAAKGIAYEAEARITERLEQKEIAEQKRAEEAEALLVKEIEEEQKNIDLFLNAIGLSELTDCIGCEHITECEALNATMNEISAEDAVEEFFVPVPKIMNMTSIPFFTGVVIF